MDDSAVGQYWDRNAPVWTQLSRQGWDVYRDHLNTPAFLAMLPDVAGLQGVDLGCGEGHNTSLLIDRGARMTGVDISSEFIRYARERPGCYLVASAQSLPFAAGSFDFATAFMSLMDMPKPESAIREAFRVLRPGGFLQFSITHPCFAPPHRRRHGDFVEVGRYYETGHPEIQEWLFSAAPAEVKSGLRPFQIPIFHRTLSEWLNSIIDAGFTIERLNEPRADEETALRVPNVADTREVAYFLHVRCRK